MAVVFSKQRGYPTSVMFLCDCGKWEKVKIPIIRHKEVPTACKSCEALYGESRLTKLIRANRTVYNSYLVSKHKMCKRWRQSFELFIQDLGTRPKGMCLCRRNTKRLHGPKNSFWGPNGHNNMVYEYKGVKVSMAEICRYHGIKIKFWEHQRSRGKSMEEIIDLWRVMYGSGSVGCNVPVTDNLERRTQYNGQVPSQL